MTPARYRRDPNLVWVTTQYQRLEARIAALEAAARAILPAAHAGIHFAFHEGNAVDEGVRYRAAYDALKRLLEETTP